MRRAIGSPEPYRPVLVDPLCFAILRVKVAMFDRLFRAHPRSVGESYGEHMRVSAGIGLRLIGGGIACLIHAVIPGFHQKTGSGLIRGLAAEIDGRAPAKQRDVSPD